MFARLVLLVSLAASGMAMPFVSTLRKLDEILNVTIMNS